MSTKNPSIAGRRVLKAAGRYWEIDTLRGVAIVMMVIFHLLWDLWFYQVWPDLVLYAGFWKYFQRTIGILFVTLAGVSMTVSYRRAVQVSGGETGQFRKFLRRGLQVFGVGLAVALVIWGAGIGYVHFGVLHLIGFSIVAGYFFLRFTWLNLWLWLLFFVAGWVVQFVHVETLWLVWLGLAPQRYAPTDYFPIVPWFGVALLGIFIGNLVYTEKGRRFPLPQWGHFIPFRVLQFLGRHSLVIYVIHQPLLFVILGLLGIIPLTF